MLNILKKKQDIFGYLELDVPIKKGNEIKSKEENYIQYKLDTKEYKNTIFYPSNKEWFSFIYSYNKSYVKSLITQDILVNNSLTRYFNMLEDKIKLSFKRRRSNKIRYSADKIYVSRAEFKHTNTKLTIMLFIHNKQKLLIERLIRKLVIFKFFIEEDLSKQEIQKGNVHINRLLSILKNGFYLFKNSSNGFFKKNNDLLNSLFNLKLWLLPLKSYNTLHNNMSLRKGNKLEQIFFNDAKRINFNKLKFNCLLIKFRKLGINSIIEKIYNKKAEIKLVELKAIHLNSDVFSLAVALKLRDRTNKVVRVLRKAILQMIKIPDLHTIITFDDSMGHSDTCRTVNKNILGETLIHNSRVNIEDHIHNVDENNTLNVIKQQVVSGVRFEASGRLTRRLTAMRAVFKYRYMGSLKNSRSSLNSLSSTTLRGYVKSNAQYTIINSKTRNGSFGLKCWVSSHLFRWDKIYIDAFLLFKNWV